ETLEPDDEARLTALAAEIARQLGRYEQAIGFWHDLLAVAPNNHGRAQALLEIARTEFELGNGESAIGACEEGLRVAKDTTTTRDLLLLMAGIELRRDRLGTVRHLLERIDGDSSSV